MIKGTSEGDMEAGISVGRDIGGRELPEKTVTINRIPCSAQLLSMSLVKSSVFPVSLPSSSRNTYPAPLEFPTGIRPVVSKHVRDGYIHTLWVSFAGQKNRMMPPTNAT